MARINYRFYKAIVLNRGTIRAHRRRTTFLPRYNERRELEMLANHDHRSAAVPAIK